MASDMIQTRVPPHMKQEAELLFASMGLNISDAIRMFLQQSINEQAIPFQPRARIPNAETQAAIQELDEGRGTRSSLAAFKASLEKLNQ